VYCAGCVGKALDEQASRRKGLLQRDPGWAVVLSLIPGLGQMYNGQMSKGLLVLGGFMFAASMPLGAIKAAVVLTLYFWNLFDSYWTAQRINQAEIPTPAPLPEDDRWESAATPAWGVLLILSGTIFLLNNLGVTWLTFDRVWPAILLGLGIWLLVVYALARRSLGTEVPNPKSQETDHGQASPNTSR
jgi:TM2 domain-containing membrane protein YozV